jgi:Cytochrome oxidase complex assembly protein 1
MSEPKKAPPWVKWVALGCLALLAFCALVVAGVAALVFGLMTRSDAYRQALDRVRESPAAVEALGRPIEPGWFVSGSINVTGPSGRASLAIPVSGPRGRGTLYVEADKRAGQWRFKLLQLAPRGGARIDLLATAPAGGGYGADRAPAPDVAPPAAPPLVSDDFDDPRSGWSTVKTPKGRVAYESGRLVLTTREPGTVLMSHYERRQITDGRIEVDVTPLSRSPAWVGIAVRRRGNDANGFFIDGSNIVAPSGLGLILPPSMHPAPVPLPPEVRGLRPLRLEVLARGPELRFSVDGRLVLTLPEAGSRKGGFSLMVSTPPTSREAAVAFDNFRVWPLR